MPLPLAVQRALQHKLAAAAPSAAAAVLALPMVLGDAAGSHPRRHAALMLTSVQRHHPRHAIWAAAAHPLHQGRAWGLWVHQHQCACAW